MNIQKLRYPQRLQYSADIPECYLDVPVPKFTIQPLVENAIRYGLEEMIDECQISVKAYTSVFSDTSPEREMLCIEIANNGSSFDDHLLEKLDSGETLPHGFGIGMLNIHKRLLIAYGSPCGLYLSNRDDSVTGEQFAVVKIICPLSSNP